MVRQRLPAPPDVVFDEWTDAARLAEWMCPRPARCLNVEADPRIGGTVRFDIEEAGRTFRVSGTYLTLERPHRVAFTWSCSTWPDPTIQTVVTVTIEPDGADTSIMTIEHELLPPLPGAAARTRLDRHLDATPIPPPLCRREPQARTLTFDFRIRTRQADTTCQVSQRSGRRESPVSARRHSRRTSRSAPIVPIPSHACRPRPDGGTARTARVQGRLRTVSGNSRAMPRRLCA